MLMVRLFSVLLCARLALSTAVTPEPPSLQFLYTAYVECDGNLMTEVAGPHGIRKAIPIVGGNFTGPHLSGKILDVGADWGLIDPRTNIFSADTRYNLRTNDGADIYIRTSGPKGPDGHLHLRIVFETATVGLLTSGIPTTKNVSLLRIDAWNYASDWNSTSFVSSTTVA
ncbi:unnamed protein product [Penicillium manginii]